MAIYMALKAEVKCRDLLIPAMLAPAESRLLIPDNKKSTLWIDSRYLVIRLCREAKHHGKQNPHSLD